MGLLRVDADGRFLVRGHDHPLTYTPNGDRHEHADQSCDGPELLGGGDRQCESSDSHNLMNKNQQYFYCEQYDIDVCVNCALSLQQ